MGLALTFSTVFFYVVGSWWAAGAQTLLTTRRPFPRATIGPLPFSER